MNPILQQDLEHIISFNAVNWDSFRGKTVLISGANGMLPSYMVETLLYLNKKYDYHIKVVALVRNEEKARKCFSDHIQESALEFLVQDVSESIHYNGDVHYIIHAASQAAPSYYGVDPVGTFKSNTLGTLNMLELAREKNVEGFLFFSTGEVYGSVEDTPYLKEDHLGVVDTLDIRKCYSESKRAGENACVCYHYQYQVPAKIVRIFHTFGPKINLNDGRVFSDFCNKILRNEDIVLKSDGSAKRCFCYVADAVQAYFLVLLNGESSSAYNVGGDESREISILELSKILVGLYPQKNLKIIFDIDKEDLTYSKMAASYKQRLPNIERISDLGWNLSTSIEDSFKRTIDAISFELQYN